MYKVLSPQEFLSQRKPLLQTKTEIIIHWLDNELMTCGGKVMVNYGTVSQIVGLEYAPDIWESLIREYKAAGWHVDHSEGYDQRDGGWNYITIQFAK